MSENELEKKGQTFEKLSELLPPEELENIKKDLKKRREKSLKEIREKVDIDREELNEIIHRVKKQHTP